jgi:hypothetical protein
MDGLQEEHEKIKEKSLNKFKTTRKMGSEVMRTQYLEELSSELNEFYDSYVLQNDRKKKSNHEKNGFVVGSVVGAVAGAVCLSGVAGAVCLSGVAGGTGRFANAVLFVAANAAAAAAPLLSENKLN